MAMPRAAWKGHLKLALVSCPVRLFKATMQAEKLSAHYIHRDTRNRVQMAPHDPMLGKVARTDLIAAYEHLDQYIVIYRFKRSGPCRDQGAVRQNIAD